MLNDKHKNTIIILLVGLLCVCLGLAIAFGSVTIPFNAILLALAPWSEQAATSVANNVADYHVSDYHNAQLIIQKIRLPRALLAALVGAVLGISGAVSQGLFRNPLADPSLIGVSAGASIGATLVIFVGASAWFSPSDSSGFFINHTIGISLVSVGAFITALLTVTLVYRLSSSRYSDMANNRSSNTSVATMLLAGIAITALAGGLTNLMEYASDSIALRRISLWRMGGLDGANYIHVGLLLGVCVIVSYGFMRHSTTLNALLLGESEARHLGIAVQKVKIRLLILIAFGVGVCVAVSGGIGFIGLIVPHIMRLILGPNHRHLLPASALAGAILLLLADTIARTVIAPTELPVGIITALIGAPFFVSLLRKRHRYGMQAA